MWSLCVPQQVNTEAEELYEGREYEAGQADQLSVSPAAEPESSFKFGTDHNTDETQPERAAEAADVEHWGEPGEESDKHTHSSKVIHTHLLYSTQVC